MAGRFITFEGIDGSGKSTQSRRFAELLIARGDEIILTREPGGSTGAEEIRNLVLTGETDRWSAETEILLFTAARRDHMKRRFPLPLPLEKLWSVTALPIARGCIRVRPVVICAARSTRYTI